MLRLYGKQSPDSARCVDNVVVDAEDPTAERVAVQNGSDVLDRVQLGAVG